jgi:hypothetical protein
MTCTILPGYRSPAWPVAHPTQSRPRATGDAARPSNAGDDGKLASLRGEILPNRAGRPDLRVPVLFGAT